MSSWTKQLNIGIIINNGIPLIAVLTVFRVKNKQKNFEFNYKIINKNGVGCFVEKAKKNEEKEQSF